MTKIKFAKNDYSLFFKDNGLESIDDFFTFSAGRIINRNTKRQVITMGLGTGNKQKDFFMKRFFSPHFKDMFFALQNSGRPCSQAACEWQNANTLLENGIDTYSPVCYGEQFVCGLEKKSFFITEKLNGRCLTEFVAENWHKFEQPEKEKLVSSLANFIRKIHDTNISLPDLYLWHIFVSPKQDQGDNKYDFAVIDLHRMRRNVRNKNDRIKNLGAFDFSISPKYFDRRLKEFFLDAYIGRSTSDNKGAIRRKINRRSKILGHRRQRPDY